MVAYESIKSKPGNMTPGTDGKTIDGMSIERINTLISKLKDESYVPHPAKRVYIPKKNGKLRPLGIPTIEDKLVQEVARMILEAIYEGSFEDTSHGFRPFRSCHSALVSIQHRFTGSRWFIEGDIKGFFDNIDHQILINTLRLRIEDERFLRLIWKFLRAGYLEVWKYNNTYSGTPQGGIISPILANIYLDQFDKYMVKYAEAFNKGKERKKNKAYSALNTRTVNKRKQWRAETDLQVKAQLFEDLKSMQKEKYKMQCSEQMDEDYRRIQYVRYADDFLIGIIGSKEECELIKKDITEFMRNELKLELSAEKTLITHAQENAKFLGFDITVRSLNTKKRNSKGILKREFSGKVMLNLSAETVKKKLMQYGAVRFTQGNGKEVWKPQARTPMVGMKVEDMVAQYDLEIRGFYNYYCIANNVSATCADFGYIMSYSLYMTVAQKLNSSVRQILFKYKKDKVFTVTYKDDKGNDRYRTLYNDGFKRRVPSKNAIYDRQPCTMYVPKATLAERLRTNVCELCGKEAPLIMHHVRTLKTVSSSTPWGKMMLNKHRKTVAVCEECFAKIKNEK
jgi:group II intron reverse transcriptase/maturase